MLPQSDSMTHCILLLATIFFLQTLFPQRYDGHFSVVSQRSPQGHNLGRYTPRRDAFTDPFAQKLMCESRESWALHEETQLLLRQQASWDVLPPGFVENFRNMTFWERYIWGHTHDDYAARWKDSIAEKSEVQTLSLVQRQAYEREAMRQWRFYQHSEFRTFIASFSVYNAYIAEIARQYETDINFAQALERLPIEGSWKKFFEKELEITRDAERAAVLNFQKLREAHESA